MEDKNRLTPHERRAVRRPMFLITFAIVLFLLLLRLTEIWEWLRWALGAIAPLFAGLAIGFLLNLPMAFLERTLFARWCETPKCRKRRRAVSLLITYLVVVALLAGLVWLVLPRVVESVRQLADSFSGYINSFQSTMDGIFTSLEVDPAMLAVTRELWAEIVGFMQNALSGVMSQVVSLTVNVTTGVFDFLMAIMLSGFLLFNKETLLSQLRRLSAVVLGDDRTIVAHDVCALANGIFGRFILGQLTESFLLGVLCFIGMSIFKMPYAPLISTIIGVTSLVPIAGAIIGTIPCALILLVIEPMQALWFVLFILILQQLEGDFLYPRVVGNAIGMSGLWVLSGILIGGGLFGAWGMLLGVPTLAVIYRLTGRWVRARERSKETALQAAADTEQP